MTDLDRRLTEGLSDLRGLALADDEVDRLAERAVAARRGGGRRRWHALRILPSAVGAAAVAGLIGALIVASPDAGREPGPLAGAPAPSFAALDGPPVLRTELPELLARSLDSPASLGCEVDRAGLRKAARLARRTTVYLAAGRPEAVAVFLAARNFSSTGCIPVADLAERGAVAFHTGTAPQSFPGRVVGVAVDGWDAIEAGGTRVPITGNVFLLPDMPLPVSATLTGPAGRHELTLAVPSRTPATPALAPFSSSAVLAAIAREPALAEAPWIFQRDGSPRIDSVPERPSLVFPPGVSYAHALRELFLEAGTRGQLPADATLGPPLPTGVVLLRPDDPGQGIAIDLRAPWAYDPGRRSVLLPSLTVKTPPPVRQGLDDPWPEGSFVAVPKLPPCMVIASRQETPTPCRAHEPEYLSDDPEVVRTALP